MSGNDDPGTHANEFGRLAKDELHDARVLPRAHGDRLRFGAGLDLAQPYEAPFGFRHNFLGENDDISVGELNAGTRYAREDELDEIVAGSHRRNTLERGQHQASWHPARLAYGIGERARIARWRLRHRPERHRIERRELAVR